MAFRDRLYATNYDQVFVLEPSTGEEKRTTKLAGGNYVTATPCLSSDLVVFPTAATRLIALKQDSLVTAWEDEAVNAVLDATPAADESFIYHAAGGELRCLQQNSGRLVWASAAPARFGSLCHGATLSNETILLPFGRGGMGVAALARADGRLLWTRRFGSGNAFDGIAYGFDNGCVVHDRTVYAGSADGCMHALSLADGSVQWSMQTDGPVLSGPDVCGSSVVFGSCDGYLYSVEATTGVLRWRLAVGGEIWNTPVRAGSTMLLTVLQQGSQPEGRLIAVELPL